MRLSIISLFYNEEGCVEKEISNVHSALLQSGMPFEIIAIQNGSQDRTAEILTNLEGQYKELRVIHVPINQGVGYGILQGLLASVGDIVGYMPGDGQIDPSVLTTIVARMEETGADIGKGRRVVRHDGRQRRFISRSYNILMRVLFGLSTRDVNGHPKLLRREAYSALNLRSYDSFIDAEILLKAQRLGFRVCEVDVVFRKRETGRSTVQWTSCLEFIRNIIRTRFGKADPWDLNQPVARSLYETVRGNCRDDF